MKRAAFTMVELLVVLGIIAVLAAILFPVLTRAKFGSRVTESKSNMRQIFLAAEMYRADHNEEWPAISELKNFVKSPILRSPLDDWRAAIADREAPLVGSYGYVISMTDMLVHKGLAESLTFPILADIFSADYRLHEFRGFRRPSYAGCGLTMKCEYPEIIWLVYTDGSLRAQKNRKPPPLKTPMGAHELFSWPGVFDREYLRKKV